MKETPILFSGAMVRAILEGRKTQTRRVITGRQIHWNTMNAKCGISRSSDYPHTFTADSGSNRYHCENCGYGIKADGGSFIVCRFGATGDRLWVRETWAYLNDLRTKDPGVYALQSGAFYRADYPSGLSHDDGSDLNWRPSIFMPRRLSRITLEITDVRVDRLQEITNRDAQAEGVLPDCRHKHLTHDAACHREEFESGWDDLNFKRGFGWVKNPWVWVITFKHNHGDMQ